MGVYIKGMKMPTGERPIHIEIHRDGTVLQWKFNESDEIIGTAVEVPPHGRTIDADALVKYLRNVCFHLHGDYNLERLTSYIFVDAIKTALTIIEAEE